jgi:hypothetical protein
MTEMTQPTKSRDHILATIRSVDQSVVEGGAATVTGTIRYPIALANGTPASVYNSAIGSGMGRVILTMRGELYVDNSPSVDRPSLTFTIVSGP